MNRLRETLAADRDLRSFEKLAVPYRLDIVSTAILLADNHIDVSIFPQVTIPVHRSSGPERIQGVLMELAGGISPLRLG